MVKTPTKPAVSLAASGLAPPRRLGADGMDLWVRVMDTYAIEDVGGIELLAQACSALDRAEQLARAIAQDGVVISAENGRRSHPACKDELACRAFIVRTLEKLGVTVEPIKPVGRPPTSKGWTGT
jgi:hypothetical protein